MPEAIRRDLRPSQLLVRLDVYQDAVLLHRYDRDGVEARLVSPLDIARVLTGRVSIASGLLPEGALWWGATGNGAKVALYQAARVWRVGLQLEAFKPPRAFALPMPGCIFVCAPGQPPDLYAVKHRPRTLQEPVYAMPVYNCFANGGTCQGSAQYSEDVARHPGEFFEARFSMAGDYQNRSQQYPKDLMARWDSLDGVKEYPLDDLVPVTAQDRQQLHLGDVLERRGR